MLSVFITPWTNPTCCHRATSAAWRSETARKNSRYFRGAWGRDAGLRIDHLLLNAAAARRLAAAGVDRDVRGWEKTSDHAPAWVELRDA